MQNRSEIIGGEFDVDLQSLKYSHSGNVCLDGLYKYSSGRSALYHILLDVKKRNNISKILLPDYLYSSVVIAAEKADVEVIFYPLNDKLELDEKHFANLYEEKCAVLLINYFGLQNLQKQVAYVRSLNKDAIIIEDDVQGFYEFQKELIGVDYKFTSLRKTFACPDGGLVKTQNLLPEVNTVNKFHQ